MKNTEDFAWVNTQIRFLQGDVLTLVDASISDPEQRKAMKDVVRSIFNRKMNHIDEIIYGGSSKPLPESEGKVAIRTRSSTDLSPRKNKVTIDCSALTE